MSRPAIVLVHLIALPVAAASAVLIAAVASLTPPQQSIEVQLHDTYFVVAHFHASIVAGACVAVVTLVAVWHKSLNWVLGAAWLLFIVHVVVTLGPWSLWPAEPRPPGGFVVIFPAYPGLAYAYLWSALGALCLSILGLVVSFVRAWRKPIREAT